MRSLSGLVLANIFMVGLEKKITSRLVKKIQCGKDKYTTQFALQKWTQRISY